MKKVFLVVAVAFFGLASCKKDYTCNCVTTDTSDGSQITSSSETITDHKSDAEAKCDEGDQTNNALGYKTECELD